jgi:hypothetical protein
MPGEISAKGGNIMRLVVPAFGLSALALVGFMASSDPATAAKTKMGCEVGKEKWNATLGRCEAAKGKATRTARRTTRKAAPKKAAPAAK